jgi:hypothetical protein
VRAWPLLDAPEHVIAGTPFAVVVGLDDEQQAGTVGGRVAFAAPAGATSVTLTVELIADGLDAPQGWTRPLEVQVNDPASARVTFDLVGRPPQGPNPQLTMIEARYTLGGTVCGTASRPLEIRAVDYVPPQGLPPLGEPWTAQPVTASPVTVSTNGPVADLTIEIAKPDGNVAGTRYVCRLYSPHPITTSRGPFTIDFGDDSKTFAKTIVDQVRQYSGNPIVDNALRSIGKLVTEKLPVEALDALDEIYDITKPSPPAVLVVSAEAYVPWELALVDPPLDDTRPPFLGAQTLLGRWLRDAPAPSEPSPPAATPSAKPSRRVRVRKPPVDPPGSIGVEHMAVMAGIYNAASSGLKKLPAAEDEASQLVHEYSAVPMAASLQALKQLLDATLEYNFQQIGGPGAVHFAGHGDYDPAHPDSSVMMLSNGTAISSLLFRDAKYGDTRQPFVFFNACMIGIGGELLGDMGGFPGNCLKGGFGGVLGALWEVDDQVAHDLALEFWKRALPKPGATGEPIAAILRDLRAKYAPDLPIPTYLAYVYYGHPRLTLHA